MSGKLLFLPSALMKLAFAIAALTIYLTLTVHPLPASSPQVVFSNSQAITINTNVHLAAAVHPSTINVSGMVGNTTKVTVSLNNFSHERASDVDILLVSPTGTKFIVMSDAIFFPINNVLLSLDQAAATSLHVSQQNFPSGSYRPTNFVGSWNLSVTSAGTSATTFSNPTSIPINDTLPLAAPSTPYSSNISVTGLSGVISNLEVTLLGLSHTRT